MNFLVCREECARSMAFYPFLGPVLLLIFVLSHKQTKQIFHNQKQQNNESNDHDRQPAYEPNF